MSKEGWGKINFNWKEKDARITFYGCNTGNDYDGQPNDKEKQYVGSFARRLSVLNNFKSAEVAGQTSYSFPSFATNVRVTSLTRSGDIKYGWGNGDTYMIGGNSGEGWQSQWFRSSDCWSKANPFSIYKNNKILYQANQLGKTL
jgi:hypothetical protein